MSDVHWPVVVADDYGIRPAGPPDACVYCLSKVGAPHGADCVVVSKRVVAIVLIVRNDEEHALLEWHTTTPYSWTAKDFNFSKNDASWCSDNLSDEIDNLTVLYSDFDALEFIKGGDARPCLCQYVKIAMQSAGDVPFVSDN